MATVGGNSPGPLGHVTVLDFTQLLQGPMATQILGDLGAEVVKFEKPGGEWMRHWGIGASRTHGEVDSFLAFNRNKKSVAVDLKDPKAVAHILELAREADVVVENFRPGVMERLGLGYEDFREANPGIVYASASGYGRTGPYRERPGQDMLAQALSGLMRITGRRDDPPTACGVGISDEVSGLHLVIAILAALEHRRSTGEGQRVEVDLLSCTVAAQQQELTVYLNHGEEPERAAANVGHVGGTGPQGIYPTTDGHIALSMFHCPTLGKILGVPWLDEFDTNEKMFAGRDRIHALLSGHFATGTTEHWIELLAAHDVWCAPVQDYAQVEGDPQVAHRALIWEVPVGDDGETFRTVGSPFSFSATPPGLRRGVPRTGQHTAEFFPEE
jgi:crotonobetainyl-CoA:carnitine CoA-transferase CaiB-like acyl-CoA transferase